MGSMKTKLLEQYQTIRKTIASNVETIKSLFDHSKTLTELVSGLKESDCSDEIVKKLEKQIEEINSSINQLILQTDQLFNLYDKFADDLFTS